VVTEGIFLRLIQADPELKDVGCVILDEFHERSLQMDTGLALALQSQSYFCSEPFCLLVMSATLAVKPLMAQLPEAVLFSSEGRSYPVVIEHVPVPARSDWQNILYRQILLAISTHDGSILVFLPGVAQINKLAARLQHSATLEGIALCYLHAQLPLAEQAAAIAPAKGRRKLVLATNVAETSLTIEGITVVIDSGLAKVPVYDPVNDSEHLVLQRISRASADQRAGRAGRLAAGHCYRLWSRDIHNTLLAFDPPSILSANLAAFLLELAAWGDIDCSAYALLDQPESHRIDSARVLLQQLDALDTTGKITVRGRNMLSLGTEPRLAALLLSGQEQGQPVLAALIAGVLSSRPLSTQSTTDVQLLSEALLAKLRGDAGQSVTAQWAKTAMQLARQWLQRLGEPLRLDHVEFSNTARLIADAFPDRVARCRQLGQFPTRYQLASGTEVQLPVDSELNGAQWLVVTDFGGGRNHATVRSACRFEGEALEQWLGQHMQKEDIVTWDEQRDAVVAFRRQSLGQITLSQQPVNADSKRRVDALLTYIKQQGLQVIDCDSLDQCLLRLHWARATGLESSPVSRADALATVEDWLLPALSGIKSASQLAKIDAGHWFLQSLDWGLRRQLETLAPTRLELPTGRLQQLRYQPYGPPVISAKMTEFYGLQQTPVVAGKPILVELLSPAGRPLQLTSDLAGFWQGSYQEVKKEMKGRYPKHFWPDDPANAKATDKTRKRM
jgi:ATP-dependent helicase HrpB